MKNIVCNDINRIYKNLIRRGLPLRFGGTVLLTGCAGFLGYYFTQLFLRYREELDIEEIIGLDNFQSGYPTWLEKMAGEEKVKLYKFNVITDNIANIPGAEKAAYVYHMASIASPTFYRQYPIETLDANIWGLRRLLDFYKNRPIKGFAFFSSSEIYGDPNAENIPTPEIYRGFVDCQGPRACYDEAKRFGETICYLYYQQYGMPIRIIRPFNNYGPGMRLNDARVPADFANAVRLNKDIVVLSDGTPTRTFCYVSDAICGYVKVILHDAFDTFNIGADMPEVSIRRLAEIYAEAGRELLGYTGRVRFGTSEDQEYLTNNPNRRCPNIDKARLLLEYKPQVSVEQGVRYFIEYIKECREEDLTW